MFAITWFCFFTASLEPFCLAMASNKTSSAGEGQTSKRKQDVPADERAKIKKLLSTVAYHNVLVLIMLSRACVSTNFLRILKQGRPGLSL